MAYIRGKPEIRSHPRDISLRHQRTSAIFPGELEELGACPLPYHGHIPHCSIVDIFAYNKCPKWRIFDAPPVKWSINLNVFVDIQIVTHAWYLPCVWSLDDLFFQFVPLRSVVSTAFSRSFCTSLLFKKCSSFEVVCCKTVVPWQFEVAVFSFGLLWLMERCSIKSVS